MIVSMLSFEIILIVFTEHFFDTLPSWAKAISLVAFFVIHLIAYASEDNLRDNVKRLKEEVEKIKKGGAE